MAVSGSYDYTRTAIQIIKSALRDIGQLAKGETPDSEDYEVALEALNLLIKSWQNKGIGLWLNEETTLYLQKDTIQYALGPSGDHWTTDPHKTEAAAAADSAATSIVVDSYTGMADGDYIGIECDDGTLHWSTIDTPASTTITIDDALDDEVSVDAHVYFYTAKAQKPIEILANTIRRVDSDANETPIELISRSQYLAINNKTNEGPVNSVYYDNQLTTGQFYVWPEPSDVQEFLRMTSRRPISDVDSLAHNVEVPPEFLLALEYNLALHCAPKFETEAPQFVIDMAYETLQDAMGLAREKASLIIK